jgi:hypothetical protein
MQSYTVTYHDGSFYTTGMNATLDEARQHFIGRWFEQSDEKTKLQAIDVEPYTGGETQGIAGSRPVEYQPADRAAASGGYKTWGIMVRVTPATKAAT